ncbi:MAG TPA: hypothetical protein VEU28_10020 [Actinomycetota bacterium]|nr:hypothetical protein [Actinomycetota bacterium]
MSSAAERNLCGRSVQREQYDHRTDWKGHRFEDSNPLADRHGILEAAWSHLAPFFTQIVSSPADTTGNTVFTFTNRVVYRSTDFGDTWTRLPVGGLASDIRNLAVARGDGDRLALIAEGGEILLSDDGGVSWTAAAGSLPNHWLLILIAGTGVESRTGAVAVGRGSRCCRRLSPCAGASVSTVAPFPVPAHRTGRAALPHPALGRTSRQGMHEASHTVWPLAIEALRFPAWPCHTASSGDTRRIGF